MSKRIRISPCMRNKLFTSLTFYCIAGGKKCKYKGVSYTRGQTILKPRAPNYDRCENCTCVRRGRFGKCKTVYYCDAILACNKEDYVFPEDDCCPVCKKTGEQPRKPFFFEPTNETSTLKKEKILYFQILYGICNIVEEIYAWE